MIAWLRGTCISLAMVTLLALVAALPATAADYELKIADARLLLNGEQAPLRPAPDYFGPGVTGHGLWGTPFYHTQLIYTVPALPAGSYVLGMPMSGFGYVAIPEHLAKRVQLVVNDRHYPWTSMTEPMLPENAAEKTRYQAELRVDTPVRLEPGDVVRAVYTLNWHDLVVGPIRLYRTAPGDAVTHFWNPGWAKPRDLWLLAKWEETSRAGSQVHQPCLLYNPGSLPRTFQLQVQARDFLMQDLLSRTETLTLQPGEKRSLAFDLSLPPTRWSRLLLTATTPDAGPPVHLARFFVNDLTEGPRPTACLNGDWEWCQVPGAEPGPAPPANARWEQIKVPSLQSPEKTHCAWYRKVFSAPPHARGERLILKCNQVLSEARFLLNGKPVGYEYQGSQPFEVDVTAAFKPGETNELLVGVRDWIAYSPVNQERVRRGEAAVFKDGMVAVAGYPCAMGLGLGGNVWLEGRPAVSVQDVSIVPAVRGKTLSLHYTLRNATARAQVVGVRPVLLDGGKPVRTLPRAQATVPAGGAATVTVEQSWPEAKLWWPDAPQLYVLQTDLEPTTGARDRHLERFGFREFRHEGTAFWLNGMRVKLRSKWAGIGSGYGWALEQWQPERRLERLWEAHWYTREIESSQLSRCHNMDSVPEVCDIADESGLMIKIEEADFAQQKFTFDPAYWQNALAHHRRVVDTYKNHPSVVIWSAGNENMWGWLYLGESVKTAGNRHQIEIARAMHEHDLQHRPVEWEADGDLMGGWEYYALHYPREINAAPDVPNGAWWGPLDGKTVVPYSMGPVTLGAKPLTVGESCIPDSFAHPYGQTILLGDEAYLGGNYWWEGWHELSRYTINGFRDVEFALIDPYIDLAMLPPQAVVLKEETRSVVGGQPVQRHANVHNDVMRPADLLLRWSLTAQKRLSGGEKALHMAPAELQRLTLVIPTPAVAAPTPARLTVELLESGQVVNTQTQDWTLHPPVKVQAGDTSALALYDPVGDTTATFRRLGFALRPLPALGEVTGSGLIIGRNALKQPPEGPWREMLSGFVRQGGKVLILEQDGAPDFLPVPVSQIAGRNSTIAHVRATDHPALSGLAADDLRWWAPDHLVSSGNIRKPLRGNWLPLVDVGSVDGLVDTALMEQYEGQGSYLLCQMALTDHAAAAPPAARLLQNLLQYLARPGCYRTAGATALLAPAGGKLRAALDDSRLVYEDMTGKADQVTAERFVTCLADASVLDAATAQALGAFAAAGGHVMIHRAGPAQQQLLQQMGGVRLRFLPLDKQPNDICYHVFRRGNAGLMAGLSNHEFFWVTNRLFADLRHNGGWWSGYDCPPQEWIADYFVSPGDDLADRAERLTRPGGLLQIPVGKGYLLLNQLRLDEPHPDCAVTVTRLRSLLLTNLGCALRPEGGSLLARQRRLRDYDFFSVDLSPYANRGLRDDRAAGLVGWTNQGENDMRALPTGQQRFADIPFLISTPRSAVVLYSQSAENAGLPREVKGIRIGRRADTLFFLHTIAWDALNPFKYRVNYEDGTVLEIPIVRGQQVMDWWTDPTGEVEAMARHGMFVAWRGDNPMHRGVTLPGWEWRNPHPDKVIRDLDFCTVPESGYVPVPVLVALTGAVARPAAGVVEDIIGTAGIKVRLGTQLQDVYYLGVAGLRPDHRVYQQALAAHRALVVGQKVYLQWDVVREDAEGRSIAWVYLDPDMSRIAGLANARIIGDGLSPIGAFSGNDRHRTYLENLAFIAQQRKAGMWAEGK
ncbi:hypothetical protein LLH23_03100 [bacterium]|nr:hypothetical protein [bacterium]